MNPDSSKRQYHPALDGLRGVAILLVVIYHNFGFINYSSFGWLGVDLFFVLSGFLITDILLRTLGEDNYLKNFYVRRILRIFPLYYLCLVIFLLILPNWNLFPDSNYYIDNQVWLWTYLQNWLYIFKGDGSTTSLHHLWSLAVEEQFYMLWPLVILVVRKPKLLLIFITLVLIGVLVLRLWIWMYNVSELSYYKLYTFTRVDGLCIGCMVALLQRINKDLLKKYTPFIVLFFALLNFAFFFINRNYDFGFPYLALAGYTTFAMMFGLLVNEAINPDAKIINVLFTNPLLRFFGNISYGLYIFHWPLYLILKPHLGPWIAENISSRHHALIVSIASTLTAIVISWLSYRFYERYFIRLKSRFV